MTEMTSVTILLVVKCYNVVTKFPFTCELQNLISSGQRLRGPWGAEEKSRPDLARVERVGGQRREMGRDEKQRRQGC